LRSWFLPIALITAGLVTGCTTSEAGTATPESTADSTSSAEPKPPESSASPTVEVPAPPRDLSLEGIDPCAVLTEAQQDELKITDVNPTVGEGSIYQDMKECNLDADSAEPFITYNLVAVTNVDLDFMFSGNLNADVRLTSVGDYPAAEFNIKGGEDVDCAIALGVAKNQLLHVEMTSYGADFTGEQLCAGSKQVAEMALQTLQTMR
jgi:hypothetical protein